MERTKQSDGTIWSFSVNGKAVNVKTSPELSLLTALRQDLDLKGTRIGCAQGNCGACTVLSRD